jgi:hemolysin III
MSAFYHRLSWSPSVQQVLQRVDHANIFLLIAGSYTPIAIICLPPPEATLLLSIVWAARSPGSASAWSG